MKLPETDDQVLVLHNPRCSKCRATVALLRERGIDFEERLYLEDRLSRAELEQVAVRLDSPPAGWVRSGQAEYGAAGLGPGSDAGAILDAMVLEPILIERPIVLRGRRAAIGRPPEQVLGLFQAS